MPHWLELDSPVPERWNESENDYRVLQRTARNYHRAQAAFAFVQMIAEKGYRPSEAATGELPRGASIGMLDGTVRRSMRFTPIETMRLGQRVLREIKLAGLERKLDGNFAADLESISRGEYGGRNADALVTQAENVVRQAQAEAQRERAEDAQLVEILVRVPFRSMGGRSWQPGRHRVTQAEQDELIEWRNRMKAQQRPGWDAPSGFTKASWPPFDLK